VYNYWFGEKEGKRMEEQFILTFPVYALLLKDGTGTILLRHGTDDIWLPLFTDRDAVQTYLERSEIKECLVRELRTTADLGDFLRNPPSRSRTNNVGWVIIDPIDNSQRAVTLLTVHQILGSLPQSGAGRAPRCVQCG
jgi:hypothetical protein